MTIVRRKQPYRVRPLLSRWSHCRREIPAGPPPPTCDLVVTGSIYDPVNGNYNQNGTYAGKPAYQHTTAAAWIWWSTPYTAWHISINPGSRQPAFWRVDPSVLGIYPNNKWWTGTPTVALPP